MLYPKHGFYLFNTSVFSEAADEQRDTCGILSLSVSKEIVCLFCFWVELLMHLLRSRIISWITTRAGGSFRLSGHYERILTTQPYIIPYIVDLQAISGAWYHTKLSIIKSILEMWQTHGFLHREGRSFNTKCCIQVQESLDKVLNAAFRYGIEISFTKVKISIVK